MSRITRHLSYANVAATASLFVALGGTSYAAVSLSKGSVQSKHLASGAVTSAKVLDGSLKARDFAAGQLLAGKDGAQGATGATGPQGAQGEPGATGVKGDQGERGAAGPQGDAGPVGPQGIPGPKGDKGDTGAQGPKGDRGVLGFYTRHVQLDFAPQSTVRKDIKCDAGDYATSGGYFMNGGSTADFVVFSDSPIEGTPAGQGWDLGIYNRKATSVIGHGYVTCADLG